MKLDAAKVYRADEDATAHCFICEFTGDGDTDRKAGIYTVPGFNGYVEACCVAHAFILLRDTGLFEQDAPTAQ